MNNTLLILLFIFGHVVAVPGRFLYLTYLWLSRFSSLPTFAAMTLIKGFPAHSVPCTMWIMY